MDKDGVTWERKRGNTYIQIHVEGVSVEGVPGSMR